MKRHILTVDSDASLDELMEVLGSLHGFQKTGRTALKYTEPKIPEAPIPKPLESLCDRGDHYFDIFTEEDGNRISRCTQCGKPEFSS